MTRPSAPTAATSLASSSSVCVWCLLRPRTKSHPHHHPPVPSHRSTDSDGTVKDEVYNVGGNAKYKVRCRHISRTPPRFSPPTPHRFASLATHLHGHRLLPARSTTTAAAPTSPRVCVAGLSWWSAVWVARPSNPHFPQPPPHHLPRHEECAQVLRDQLGQQLSATQCALALSPSWPMKPSRLVWGDPKNLLATALLRGRSVRSIIGAVAVLLDDVASLGAVDGIRLCGVHGVLLLRRRREHVVPNAHSKRLVGTQ